MPLQKIWSFALAVIFIAFVVLGCSRHPELKKTNEKGASQWNLRQTRLQGQPDLIILTIAAGNKIDTPAGEKVAVLGVSCGGVDPFSVDLSTAVEAESGDVSTGFDEAALAGKKWEVHTTELKDRKIYTMHLLDADQSDFLRQLRHSGTFQFEFTPKGGKPQLSNFKLLNINSLLEQQQSCKSALEHVH